MTLTNLNNAAGLRPPGSVVAGPWPNYTNCRHLPERERWAIYGLAKAGRMALEDRGIVMDESYDAFIKRVCTELDL
jgi:hypothetical protein